jgi:hypothetical protein
MPFPLKMLMATVAAIAEVAAAAAINKTSLWPRGQRARAKAREDVS